MKLSEALTRPSRLQSPKPVDLTLLASASARIIQRWPDIVPDPQGDRDKIIAEFADRLRRGNWSDFIMARAVLSARIAFDADFRHRPNLGDVRDFLVEETKASTSGAFLGAMCSIYISTFLPGADHSVRLARALETTRGKIAARWQLLLTGLPELFSPDRVIAAIAGRMMDMEHPWAGLKNLGMPSPHAPGLMDAAHLEFVRQISPLLNRQPQAEKLIGWLRPEGQPPRASGAAPAIDALLAHWENGAPPADFQIFLLRALVSFYGDPRVVSGTAWDLVSKASRSTILRWLTGENIRLFLDVVSQVETSHMWAPRRKFWLGLYNQKKIDEAWVAFSPAAVRVASRLNREKEGAQVIQYGRQTAGGTRSDTSLLILRLGRCIAVEGSHSYQVYVFKDSNSKAPKLFQPQYDCEAIRLIQGSESYRHLGNWQDRVKEKIEYWR